MIARRTEAVGCVAVAVLAIWRLVQLLLLLQSTWLAAGLQRKGAQMCGRASAKGRAEPSIWLSAAKLRQARGAVNVWLAGGWYEVEK
jgi:hypothetical protein